MATGHIIERDWIGHGLVCMAVVTDLGHRCGYVGVDRHHFLYQLDYSCHHRFLKSRYGDEGDASPETCFLVHGGLTFSGAMDEHKGLWFFGFDCAHLGDAPDPCFCPKNLLFSLTRSGGGGVVRTLDFVVSECERLAQQLSDILGPQVWIVDEVPL